MEFFAPVACSFIPETYCLSEVSREEDLPAVAPGIFLGQIPIVRRAMEPELASWGCGFAVESCEARAERGRAGHPFYELVELAQVEIGIGVALEGPPGDGLRAEVGGYGVDLRGCFELALDGFSSVVTSGDLRIARGQCESLDSWDNYPYVLDREGEMSCLHKVACFGAVTILYVDTHPRCPS